jgi:formylglycine-generating enzyme required for sulfatase activity
MWIGLIEGVLPKNKQKRQREINKAVTALFAKNGNEAKDGFMNTSPVKSFPPNEQGIYDLIGNVWEITNDWYDAIKFERIAGNAPLLDSGMNQCYNPNNPYAQERVIKGGSYLCADNYCVNYRPTARQGHAYDSGSSNVGFRCVKDSEPHLSTR